MQITWLGQGGFLFEAGVARIAVDPYLSDALADKDLPRLYPPPVTPERLAPTLVVFTHDHSDHFDPVTVGTVLKACPGCLLAGSAETMAHAAAVGASESQCTVLEEGASMKHAPFTITVVPAEHSGGAIGVVIADGAARAYVSGDTLYRDDIAAAVKNAAGGAVDFAAVCINGRWGNMSAEDALRLVREIRPRAAAPMHYDLFANNRADPRPFLKGCRAMGVKGVKMTVGKQFDPRARRARSWLSRLRRAVRRKWAAAPAVEPVPVKRIIGMKRFEGKITIVTGSSSGIGKSIALQMAREGAAVTVVADSNVDGGEATVREITDAGGRAMFVRADVSKEDDCRRVARETIAAFGGIDILVNNAGITRAKPLEEMEEDFWDRVIDTNLKSAYLMSRAVIENMLSRGGGAVVNISSVHAVLTHPKHTAYAASKAGMCGMTRALGLEFARRGVRFNAILPGATDISLHPRSNEPVDREKWRPRARDIQPTGRSGSPDEISEAVCFLASDAASYITGATLAVDGGLLAILRDR